MSTSCWQPPQTCQDHFADVKSIESESPISTQRNYCLFMEPQPLAPSRQCGVVGPADTNHRGLKN